jgi:hypothetical protein
MNKNCKDCLFKRDVENCPLVLSLNSEKFPEEDIKVGITGRQRKECEFKVDTSKLSSFFEKVKK